MLEENLILEKKEYVILKRILNLHKFYRGIEHKDVLTRLQNRLARAEVKDEAEMPGNLVRLHSKVCLSRPGEPRLTFHIVLPAEEDLNTGKISVINKLGASLLGLYLGETVEVGLAPNSRKLKITHVGKPVPISYDTVPPMDY